jgi:hypothetical protein
MYGVAAFEVTSPLVTLVAFIAFVLGIGTLAFTFEFRRPGPLWLIPLAYLAAVFGGAGAMIAAMPWFWPVPPAVLLIPTAGLIWGGMWIAARWWDLGGIRRLVAWGGLLLACISSGMMAVAWKMLEL